MATTIDLGLADGVTLTSPSGEDVYLEGHTGRLTMRRPSEGLRAALAALVPGPVAETALAALAGSQAALLFYHLESAADLGMLRWTVVQEGRSLASLSPVSPFFTRSRASIDPGTSYKISRFVHSRADGERTVLESPLSHAVVTLHDRRAAALVFDLSRPISPRAAASETGDLDVETACAIFGLLAEAGMIATGPTHLETEVALRQWEPHDLLFHARSRGQRHGASSGGNYRFLGKIPPLPAVKPPSPGPFVELDRPDIEALRREDLPFTEVLERRRSLRSRGPAPLTAEQLGHLLFRSARVRQIRQSPQGDLTDRPYPNAGAEHELEIYPVVNLCEGVPSGMYHYCPLFHRLERVSGDTAEARALLEGAGSPEGLPDVVLVIAARFQRIAWKYESIAYSLILKDAGVLLQTIYLVATAMHLAPCAIGHGDPDLFCRAAGTDYFREGSVAEMALRGAIPGASPP